MISVMSRTAKLSTALAALALTATMLAGCSTTAPAAADPTPTAPKPTASAAPEPASAVTTAAPDEVTCAAFGDVVTILGNVDVALNEDRMGQQEKNGWYALASRVLANVPSADAGPVAEALAAVKAEVPPAQGVERVTFGKPGGAVFGADLYEACRAAGFEVVLNGFTGG